MKAARAHRPAPLSGVAARRHIDRYPEMRITLKLHATLSDYLPPDARGTINDLAAHRRRLMSTLHGGLR